jgi:SAM-dependent methyltransferase
MGVWEQRVLPRLVDLACGQAGFERWRQRASAPLTGRVVEIGFGSGRNVPHYPAAVTELLAVEPSARARELAAARIAGSPVPVVVAGLDGTSLELDDDSCDAALSTFTLCTVPDPATALAELRRVVRPGGLVSVLEHGRSPDAGVLAWQQRLEPLQRRVAGGCHLTRDPAALLTGAGLELVEVEQRYAKGPKPFTYLTVAVARVPGPSAQG